MNEFADPTRIKLLGVHPVAAREPCHLIEIALNDPKAEFDFSDITQPLEDQPISNWQVAYDEQRVYNDGVWVRWVFLFHDLQLNEPLQTSFGRLKLISPTETPDALRHIEYLPP